MRLDDLTVEREAGGGVRHSARLVYEGSDRVQELVMTLHAGSGAPPPERAAPDALLAAAYPLAALHGEERVTLEGPVSPRLGDGLAGLAAYIRERLGRPGAPVLEPRRGFRFPDAGPDASGGTGVFMSGGVDSLAILADNHAAYGTDHPWRIREALFLFGLNTYDWEGEGSADPAREAGWRRRVEEFRPFLEAHGCRLRTAWTNVRSLYPGFRTWGGVGYVAGITSTAHLPGLGQARMLFGSTGTGRLRVTADRHPALAHLISTEGVSVLPVHLGVHRLRKLAWIVDLPGAMEILTVCFWREIPGKALNCGRCEKCQRTLATLAALGRLDAAAAFDSVELDPAAFRKIHRHDLLFLGDLVEPLRRHGHREVARVLERGLARARLRRRVREVVEAIRPPRLR